MQRNNRIEHNGLGDTGRGQRRSRRSRRHLGMGGHLALAALMLVAPSPGLAQDPPLPTQLSGRAGGSTSLPDAIAATPRDANGNPCVGYGSFQPSHTITLPAAVPQLQLRVSSGRDDTTLVVKGPGGTVFCGDDPTADDPGAIVTISAPAPGPYQIWVGTFTPGGQPYYQLDVKTQP